MIITIEIEDEVALYDALDESGKSYRVIDNDGFNGSQASRLGVRGGHTESLDEARQIYSAERKQELDRIRNFIIWTAAQEDEVHADDLAGLEISSLNIIGVAFNSLARSGYLEKLNKDGEVEHRKATSRSSHGRASYVWRLSESGVRLATAATRQNCQPFDLVG